MKVKAVIFRPDRTVSVNVIKAKKLRGQVFHLNGNTYFLNPNRMMVTTARPWANLKFKEHYSTFYYIEGSSNPLALPDFKPLVGKVEMVQIPDGDGKTVEIKLTTLKERVDEGIKAAEFNAIFDPWFYKTISAHEMSIWEQIQLLVTFGIAIGVVFIIYLLVSGSFTLPDVPVTP